MGIAVFIGQVELTENDALVHGALSREYVARLELADDEGPKIPGADSANEFSMSAVGWHEFVEMTGLWDFVGIPGSTLTPERYAVVPLLPEHLERIHQARTAYQGAHPTATITMQGSTENFCLGALVWFNFWMTWALKTCAQPSVYNY